MQNTKSLKANEGAMKTFSQRKPQAPKNSTRDEAVGLLLKQTHRNHVQRPSLWSKHNPYTNQKNMTGKLQTDTPAPEMRNGVHRKSKSML